jgi:hypothetical protein
VCGLLHAYSLSCRDAGTIQRAKHLQAGVARIVLHDMAHKYSMDTPVAHVADYERKILTSNIRPSGQ